MSRSLLDFTEALWAGGEILLQDDRRPDDADIAASLRRVQDFESQYRRTLPANPPDPDLSAVRWSLTAFHRACQFLVYRELDEALLKTELSAPCPVAPNPASVYGVDLTFRYLPELLRLARSLNPQDPLVERLRIWSNQWPLSSVGIKGVEPDSVAPFWEHPSLRILYVDRIVATGDASRLGPEPVKLAVREALGGFRELSPILYDCVYESAPATN